MVDSIGRSTRVSIGSFSTSVGLEENSSYNGVNLAITSGPGLSTSGSSTTSISTRTGGSRSVTFAAMLSRIFLTSARISLHSATRSLNCGLSSLG